MLMTTCKGSLLTGLFLLAAASTSCDDFGLYPPADGGAAGELRWVLDRESVTKAAEELPDTNDFLLTIRDGKGNILYDGTYGDSPQSLSVGEGNYTVTVVSSAFTTPAFAKPQYGDEQVVRVNAGSSVTVRLRCTLRNAGIRLKIAADFLTSLPDGILYVQQADVKLKYQYRETRIAYVKPGEASILLYNQGNMETLFTRTLEPREILTVSISAPAPSSGGQSSIVIQTDTTKTWSYYSYVIGSDHPGQGDGGGNSGEEPQDALSVGEAGAHIGQEDVWVYGYIVGGDLTSAGKNVKTSGITKNTHLAIASRSSVTDKASCLAVELPKGSVRDALNLVDHPDLTGTRVYLKGNLVESYFGTKGMKATSDFVLK